MKAITTIYWLRAALGVTAGAICAIVARLVETKVGIDGTATLLYSITLALLIYLLSVRLLKAKFLNKVEKPSKITMTGIGIYFIAWLAFYTLFYTIILAATNSIPIPEAAPTPSIAEIALLL
jgi:uncharacterized membrane protein YbhN (UPF0104 family)